MAKKRAVRASKKAGRRTLKKSARRDAGKAPKKQKAVKKRTKKIARKGAKRAAPRKPGKTTTEKRPTRQRRAASPRRTDTSSGMPAFESLADESRAFVVVEMSNNGPHDIRAITVNQIHVVENVATTSARNEFDISAHFNPPIRIGWEIFAGMQFPRAGVFLVRPGQPAQPLGQQAPLKRGVPWLDEKPVN